MMPYIRAFCYYLLPNFHTTPTVLLLKKLDASFTIILVGFCHFLSSLGTKTLQQTCLGLDQKTRPEPSRNLKALLFIDETQFQRLPAAETDGRGHKYHMKMISNIMAYVLTMKYVDAIYMNMKTD